MSTTSNHVTSADLIKRSEELRQQAEDLKKKEAPEVLERIKVAIEHYGFSADDLGVKPARPGGARPNGHASSGPKRANGAKGSRPSVVRFRDSEGNTWSGFGPKPKWFKTALAAGIPPEALKV